MLINLFKINNCIAHDSFIITKIIVVFFWPTRIFLLNVYTVLLKESKCLGVSIFSKNFNFLLQRPYYCLICLVPPMLIPLHWYHLLFNRPPRLAHGHTEYPQPAREESRAADDQVRRAAPGGPGRRAGP